MTYDYSEGVCSGLHHLKVGLNSDPYLTTLSAATPKYKGNTVTRIHAYCSNFKIKDFGIFEGS